MLGISRFSIILIGSVLIAVLGARPYASSWNDGSRLATVEALVDQHTWAIDNSIFVKVPEQHDLDPYGRDVPSTGGTMDKIFINGHFYSHEPPVVALYMAGVYWVAQKLTGLTAAQHPHAFVYLITVISTGLAYVIGVVCIWFLALRLGLPESTSSLITVSFGLATLAPVYSRQVNNQILALAAVAAIFLLMTSRQRHAVLLGFLAGMTYALDLGTGPVLILAMLIYVCLKWRNVNSLLLCVLGMLPFVVLHHWFNYSIGGTIRPCRCERSILRLSGLGLFRRKHDRSLSPRFCLGFDRVRWRPPGGAEGLPAVQLASAALAVWCSERVADVSSAAAGTAVGCVALRRHVDALWASLDHHRSVGLDPLVRSASGPSIFWIDAHAPSAPRSSRSIQDPHHIRNDTHGGAVLGWPVPHCEFADFLADRRARTGYADLDALAAAERSRAGIAGIDLAGSTAVLQPSSRMIQTRRHQLPGDETITRSLRRPWPAAPSERSSRAPWRS